MKRWRYISQGVMQPSTVGAAMDLDVIIVEVRSIYDSASFLDVFSWPLTILGTTQVEGVDTPFFTYFQEAMLPSVFPHARRRASWHAGLRSTAYNQGMPLPIQDAPPDTTPFLTPEVYEIPSTAYAARKRKAWARASYAAAPVPGYSSEFTPAADYTDMSCRLLSEIQRHLLESTIDGGLTWSLWTQAEVLSYLNQRLVRFMMETGLIQARTTISSANGVDTVPIPADSVEIRRVAWNTGSAVSSLVRTDAFQQDHGLVGWSVLTGTPYAYVEAPLNPLEILLTPTPSISGTVDLVYVRVPAAVTGTCLPLPIPSFLTPYIKYGVMADMLMKQGEANDPDRAEYCESRFKEGVEATKTFLGVK